MTDFEQEPFIRELIRNWMLLINGREHYALCLYLQGLRDRIGINDKHYLDLLFLHGVVNKMEWK